MLRRQKRQKPRLRYFLYISDAKLDMLFEQIDPPLRQRISAEIKVDLKLASMTLRQAERPAMPPTARVAKLRVVERYIDAHHEVGTLSVPGREFFRGSLDMQWGWLARRKDAPPDDRLPVVFFRGRRDQDFVALAGSRSHVLGQHPVEEDANAEFGFSSAPSIVAVVRDHVSDLKGEPHWPYWGEDWNSPDHPLASEPLRLDFYLSYAASYLRLDAPLQALEFLAVPLGEAEFKLADGTLVHGVLGSPVYVAHAAVGEAAKGSDA